jgi:ribonuclease P protein component
VPTAVGRLRVWSKVPVTRLRRSEDILRVYRRGRGLGNRLVRLKVLRRDDAEGARAAVVVSGKVGKAVVRNKVRRRLREILRRGADSTRPVDLVLTARPDAATASFADLCEAVEHVLRGARLSARPRRQGGGDR